MSPRAVAFHTTLDAESPASVADAARDAAGGASEGGAVKSWQAASARAVIIRLGSARVRRTVGSGRAAVMTGCLGEKGRRSEVGACQRDRPRRPPHGTAVPSFPC